VRRVPPGDAAAAIRGPSFADLPPDPEVRLACAAAALAIADAGLDAPSLARAALVVTYEAPGMDRLLRSLWKSLAESAPRSDPADAFRSFYRRHREAAYGTHSFLHLHILARALGIHGPALFTGNACASGLYALEAGAMLIAGGHADLALVVAAESPLFPAKMLWFAEAGLHSPDGFLRPFDRERAGLVLGEGACALVLERPEAALARGARVLGEYLGGAFRQEGWKVTVPNFADPCHEECIRGAIASAGLEPADVDAVVAHGAGTSLSDAYEAKALTAVFGDWPQRPAVTALKGHFGHTLGASALLEAAAGILAMETGALPAALGFRDPDPKLKVAPLERPAGGRWDIVLKISNGFAGFNGAAVFGRAPGPRESA
jgi:3-oxoacyl-(acyl-carrier-protein) synthase